MPVGRYDQGSRSLNRWNRNEQHMRMDMRIPYITVSWNLQWGRQKRSVNKLVNSDANVDSSKAAGREQLTVGTNTDTSATMKNAATEKPLRHFLLHNSLGCS